MTYREILETNWRKYQRRKGFHFWLPGRRFFEKSHEVILEKMAQEKRFDFNSYAAAKGGLRAETDWINELVNAVIAALGAGAGPWGPIIALGIRLIVEILLQSLNEYFQTGQYGLTAADFQDQVHSWATEAESGRSF